MIDEMTGPGGWGLLEQITAAGGARPVVAGDAGYGDNTTFRMELEDRGWQYLLAVRGTTSAYAGDAQPVTPARRGGPGRPSKPAYPGPPANLRQLAIASADQIHPVTWRRGTKATKGNPGAAMTSHFVAIRVRPANRDIPRAGDGGVNPLAAHDVPRGTRSLRSRMRSCPVGGLYMRPHVVGACHLAPRSWPNWLITLQN